MPLNFTIFRELQGELISKPKCKRQAALLQTSKCIQNVFIATNQKPINSLEQANLTQDNICKIQSSERKSIEQTGTELLSQENYQTIVFLSGPESQPSLPNLVELTRSAPEERVITDTGQPCLWLVEPSDESISFLDDLLVELPASAHQGELNTPTIGRSKVLKFAILGQLNIKSERPDPPKTNNLTHIFRKFFLLNCFL